MRSTLWARFLLITPVLLLLGAMSRDSTSMAIQQAYGQEAVQRYQRLARLVKESQRVSVMTKLQRVNDFYNQLKFIDDIHLWGKPDYWASPLEFIGAGGGDCEDFSLAKYYSLRELGIADKQLRLVYVKALSLNQFHMVLAYYPQPSAMPLLLDNLNPKILPANQRMDLAPVYSFNASELWLQREHGVSETVGSADRLSRWREVKQRVEQQKLQRPKIRLDANPL
ncbi:transglutaminase-like cysteine peptidase [Plesiomonas shigelloides]|uniref:Sulfate adenylyltransferase n=2 Tax=Plesiomonas TaxID=702 RepID=R8APU0_PLESH|nr:transglutaminase-like cysteine peptidase [Plesiomonas shigelloides]EON88343.1 hypothetical protein PLESHI_11257 [Plesiomonas shigelloides 302-73]KAB7703478.1 sulfate adenylyltransferase [Plesiomonas shigelloides]